MFRRLLFRNFKLFYLINQQLRRRYTTHGLMLVVVMFAGGVFGIDTRSTLAFQVFSIALVLLMVAMTYALFFRGRFQIKRTLPEYGTVGQTVSYTCRVNNLKNKAYKQLLLIDDLDSEFPGYDYFINSRDPLDKKRNRVDRYLGYPRLVNLLRSRRGGNIKPVTIEHIAERGHVDVKLKLTPIRRGYLHFTRIRIAAVDPMGLFQAQTIMALPDKLLILPRLYQAPSINLPGHRVYQAGGTNRASLSGDSQEFVSLREYRPGDPLRSIHWRSYAKRGEPIVKEYQDEYFVRYGLILDTWLNNNTSEPLFEDAVSIAASFMAGQSQQDTLMDLMFIGNQAYKYTAGRGHNNIQAILEVLACIHYTTENNFDQLQALLSTHAHECCGLLCVFLSLDEKRTHFLEYIDTLGLPTRVLIVSDDNAQATTASFNNIEIHFIQHDSIQADLDKLTARATIAA